MRTPSATFALAALGVFALASTVYGQAPARPAAHPPAAAAGHAGSTPGAAQPAAAATAVEADFDSATAAALSSAITRTRTLQDIKRFTDSLTTPTEYVRERFSYNRFGRPDPLMPPASVARKDEALPVLLLSAILYDPADPKRSVAILRIGDAKGEAHRVSPGDRIGQIEITSIQPTRVAVRIRTLSGMKNDVLTLTRKKGDDKS